MTSFSKRVCAIVGLLGSTLLLALASTGSTAEANAPAQARTLCEKGEQIVFSCELKRPARIVSLCSSRQLTKSVGYLQYRFGLPGKVELVFPEKRDHSQESFQYKHYFRAQVDLTEISFTSGSYTYTVNDDYNGEEKPAVSHQGVTVTSSAGKDTRMICSGRATANFADLGNALPSEHPN